MSGTNPFRRRATAEQSFTGSPRQTDHIPISSNPDSGIPPIDTDVRHVKAKASKTVRIISPRSAEEHDPIPDDFYNTRDSPHRLPFSPPPDLSLSTNDIDQSPEDPFGADSEGIGSATEDEGTTLNTQANAGQSQNARQTISPMPANPFKNTLASQEKQDVPGPVQHPIEQNPIGSSNPPLKPQYDVDDFTRLLMTGEKNASKPTSTTAPSVSFGQPHNADSSSSNTDASSVSRQSIFEPIAAVHHDSPRSSQDVSDDERQALSVASESKTSKSKPSAPKPRHGKPVQPSGPQTVPFEDPALSFASLEGAELSSGDHKASRLQESPVDGYKPLPTLPFPSTSQGPSSIYRKGRIDPLTEPKEPQSNSLVHKKPAPTPPPTRRTRPMSISSVNSGRSTPISEEITAESMQTASSPPNRPPNAPAPPPPRRSKSFRTDASSSTPSYTSATGSSDQSIPRDESTTPLQLGRNPMPSKQSPTVLASKGPSRTSTAPVSPSMASPSPPPPPPPRRRTSSQSSNNYTPSRLSGNYIMPATERLRSDSGASSISQLPMTNLELNSEHKPDQKDVLADLTALQREVDELRGKMR